MQILGSISYVSLAAPFPPLCVANLLNHRKTELPFENTSPGMLLLFFWPQSGALCACFRSQPTHTRKKTQVKKQ